MAIAISVITEALEIEKHKVLKAIKALGVVTNVKSGVKYIEDEELMRISEYLEAAELQNTKISNDEIEKRIKIARTYKEKGMEVENFD